MLKEYEDGCVYFLGNKIDLSFKPLIPRQETEYWVGETLKEIPSSSKCLDLFSGSGCIGVSLLKKGINCDFGEVDDNFIKQIEKNTEGFDCKIIKTDIFSNINNKYDYILANPPYVELDRIDEVGEDTLKQEPHIALFSGSDGLDIIRVLVKEAKDYLNKDGKLVFEFDKDQKQEIEKIIKENNYSRFDFFKDQFDEYRFVVICN
jgi:release factor glutamine methyltransferase